MTSLTPGDTSSAAASADCAEAHAPGYPQCCPFFQHSVELIGRRWTGAILLMLGEEALRFSEIRCRIAGLSDRLLDTRLTELEAEGIVARHEEGGEVRYRVTPKGAGLAPVFAALQQWAETHADVAPDVPGRRRC